MSRMNGNSESGKDEREGSGVGSPRPSDQFLKVPNSNYGGLASRMDFILRKRTRLLERQKTKEK